jgi:spermidine synthase
MLELTVFFCGMLVMVLEMAGVRVLAPHVGTSVIVWTSLIGVILACLALGNWAGGRLADRCLSRQKLALIIGGAGLGSGLTALCHGLMGGLVSSLGNLYLAALLTAALLFALPAFFFGMVSPYAIRLRMHDAATAGRTIGRLSALATIGSIAGTFLGGFVLISFFGSGSILWAVAIAAIVLAICHARIRGRLQFGLLLLGLAMLVLSSQQGRWSKSQGDCHMIESPYNSIRIFEGVDPGMGGRRVRLMATDPGYSQSGMYVDEPEELYFRYTQYYALGPFFVPHARRVLMLGGGGYSVPKWLLSPRSPLGQEHELQLTVVELDPVMTDVARRHFGLRHDQRLRVRHEDARVFLNRQQDQYDLVFVDVFNSHYAVPFQMGTCEAGMALRRAVAPGGVLLMNIISAVEGADGRLFQSICKALRPFFAHLRVYCVDGDMDCASKVGNLMLLAFTVAPQEDIAAREAAASPQIAEMLRTRYAGSLDFATPALTDDFAPVERYSLMLLQQ